MTQKAESQRADPRGRTTGRASDRLLLAVDVGNTNIVFGVYRGESLVESFRLATARNRTADEYGALLVPLFERAELPMDETEGVIISSVVPPLNPTLDWLSRRFFGCPPLFVEPGVKTGMTIRYDNPAEVGADRIVNALAARELYGAPVVVVDFGTATTFDVVNAAGEYIGGIIAPGIGISAEALFAQASRLYRVDLKKPAQLVGSNTGSAMQAGIYYGYLGLVDGILERLRAEQPGQPRVIATGGQADLVASGSRFIETVDRDLTLVGLRLIYERNRPRA